MKSHISVLFYIEALLDYIEIMLDKIKSRIGLTDTRHFWGIYLKSNQFSASFNFNTENLRVLTKNKVIPSVLSCVENLVVKNI